MKNPDEVSRWIKESKVSSHVASAAVWAKDAPPAAGGDVSTIFDLASLTKPVCAYAVYRSGMDISAPISKWIPEIEGTETAEVSLELLLSHRSGLEAHANLYLPMVTGGRVDPMEAIVQAARCRISKKMEITAVYSDLGYMLAGIALARHAKARDAGEAMREIVLRPLGLEIGCARDFADVIERSAPTEEVDWRGGVIRGRVHDENAWALTGEGGSGHAGLFGTIEGVAKLAQHFLFTDLGWMVERREGGTLRAGFDGKSEEGSSAGTVLGPNTFGHLGFTGTSMWMDPDAKIAVVLLTNRVHPTRKNDTIRKARPQAHDDLARYALARREVSS